MEHPFGERTFSTRSIRHFISCPCNIHSFRLENQDNLVYLCTIIYKHKEKNNEKISILSSLKYINNGDFEDCKWVFQDYLDDAQGNCLLLSDPEEDKPDEPVIVVPPVTEDNIQQETVWGETVEYEESETSAPVSVAFGNANSISTISFEYFFSM